MMIAWCMIFVVDGILRKKHTAIRPFFSDFELAIYSIVMYHQLVKRKGAVPCSSILALLPSWELTYPSQKALWKMIFLFPRWDMLVYQRVIAWH